MPQGGKSYHLIFKKPPLVRGEGVGVKVDQGVQGAQDALDFLSARCALVRGQGIEREGGGERAAMFRPVIPLERFGNGVLSGCKARVPRRGAGLRSAFSRHHCTENAPPRHPRHLTHDVVPVAMHVLQRLLHGLHMFDRHLEEMVSRAEETTELAEVRRRAKRRRQYPITLARLPPSTIEALRCGAARDILDVARIDEGDRTPAGRKHLTQRHPVYPRRFHGACRDTTGVQPVGQTMQVTGKGAKVLERLGIATCGHTDPMLLSAHIDASGMRVQDGQVRGKGRVLRAFFRHTCLQSGAERGEPGILLRQDTLGGGTLRGAKLFQLD